ncbi:MAG: O-antigen ligase family protein, partial [Solirubrobacteraceae bacterium]|nr:O-antigen ligase family protein [Solirubrobacteraceae bacterium]
MPGALRTVAVAAILLAPTALAFRSGGYFDQPRLVAAIATWALVAILAVSARRPLPAGAPGRLALAGLAVLTALVGLSIAWAPLAGPAQADVQRLLLYLGALVVASAVLRGRAQRRLVEPALLAGALVVCAYGLGGRLLPGIVSQSVSSSAFGRLEQPLTYWNAMGMLGALGVVFGARLAADATRDARLRAAAAAGAVPCGLVVYLSFSRGALLALAVGLALLVLLSRERVQLRAALAIVAPTAAVCLLAGLLDGPRALEGSLGAREAQGAVLLAALVAAAAVAATPAPRRAGVAAGGPQRALPHGAAGAMLAVLGGFLIAAGGSGGARGEPAVGAQTQRLASVESNRYAYWRVAAAMFAREPLAGEGSGAFRVAWRRDRTIDDPALDAHSLYVETAGELGLLGLLALAAF